MVRLFLPENSALRSINFRNSIIHYEVWLDCLSWHEEHNKWPLFLINTFLDLSISTLQIIHLKIGMIVLLFFY